jgi:hypothetical protein
MEDLISEKDYSSDLPKEIFEAYFLEFEDSKVKVEDQRGRTTISIDEKGQRWIKIDLDDNVGMWNKDYNT